ncbi:MAG: hypothetical protein M3065_11765, partial [Actinomycetota bacterium]|nr:hypothetical protein [Actinomycetota bacterium]
MTEGVLGFAAGGLAGLAATGALAGALGATTGAGVAGAAGATTTRAASCLGLAAGRCTFTARWRFAAAWCLAGFAVG